MKKLISIVISISFLFSLCSCDSAESGVTIEGKRVVALSSDAADFTVTVEYCEENGYSYNTYNTFEDCLLAIENGKAEYLLLNDFQYKTLKLSNEDVNKVEQTDYKNDFCAVFSKDNDKLYTEFNEAIKELKKNGTLEAVYQGYFKNERVDVTPKGEYKGELTVLCSSDFEGRVFYNAEEELDGLETYFVEAVLTYLGYTPSFLDYDFDEMFIKLEDGKGDLIFSAVEYTQQRARNYLLTESYYSDTYCVYEKSN